MFLYGYIGRNKKYSILFYSILYDTPVELLGVSVKNKSNNNITKYSSIKPVAEHLKLSIINKSLINLINVQYT